MSSTLLRQRVGLPWTKRAQAQGFTRAANTMQPTTVRSPTCPLACCLLFCRQDEKNSLLEEVRWYQAQQLNSTDFAVRDSKARKRPTHSTQ